MGDRTQSSAPVVTRAEPEIERLAQEVAELRAARAADRAELEAVRAHVMGQHGSLGPDAALRRDRSPKRRLGRRRDGSEAPDEPSGLVSRRRLFGLVGSAAAVGTGLAVAGSTLAADPAGAVSGGNVVIDGSAATNSGTGTTNLASTTTGTALAVSATGQGATGVSGTGSNGTSGGGGTGLLGQGGSASGFQAGTGVKGVGGSGSVDAGGMGVFGQSGSGGGSIAVFGDGEGSGDIGVSGRTIDASGGPAVQGVASGGGSFPSFPSPPVAYGGQFYGRQAALLLAAAVSGTGAPASGTHNAGELYVDTAHALFYCTASGMPGTWVKMSSPLVAIPPARVYDSRVGQLPSTGPKSPITNGATVNLDVTGTQAAGGPSGVPVGASTVLGNITVVTPSAGVFLTVFAQGATPPATSNINANAGQVVANNFTSKIGTSNGISIKCGGGPTDFIVDIFGYYP